MLTEGRLKKKLSDTQAEADEYKPLWKPELATLKAVDGKEHVAPGTDTPQRGESQRTALWRHLLP